MLRCFRKKRVGDATRRGSAFFSAEIYPKKKEKKENIKKSIGAIKERSNEKKGRFLKI
jgi:hypothetical protein